MSYQLAAGAAYIGYLIMVVITARMLNLVGPNYYIFLGLMSAIGLGAAIFFVWLWGKMKRKGGAEGSAESADSGGGDEVDGLLREAEARLSASRLAQGSGIGNLPLIFVLGPAGSTKTSTVLHSGMEPELLAGQVYQENNVVAPTRTANLWFGRNAVFAELGAKLLEEPARWVRAIRRMRPGALKSVVGASTPAPRATLLCIDVEMFARGGSADQFAVLARMLQARLGEISQTLGISFPVYVLFTRTDRVPFFAEYVRTFTNEEANQVFGVTLPIRQSTSGVYAEEETQRLSAAFNGLFHGLCDHRIDFLPRESDADKLPGAYEFPREFRKLRASLVQFLVDVGRPSQLQSSPFLRGFYFSGVRPITVTENVIPLPQQVSQGQPQAGATGMFSVPQALQQGPSQPQYAGTKKVPQWLFLGHLFPYVILKDHAAMGASASSTKVSGLRRTLLIATLVLCTLLSILFITSFFKNRALEREALDAARAISPSEANSGSLPSLDALRHLDDLRLVLLKINGYENDGAPIMMRWGLYSGTALQPEVRTAYYNRFKQLLFGQTQVGLHDWLDKLPSVPGPTDEYSPTYDTLKAYLITTSNHDKSTRSFLSPLLLSRWSDKRGVDPERMQLAQKQFDFYSEDLKIANPYSSENDSASVDRGRRYLSQFSGLERVYQFMLTEADRNNPPVNYNKKFPGTAAVVANNRDVRGAFTKNGWGFMQAAIKKAAQYFGGERWVLGDYTASNFDLAKLQQQLQDRYTSDFINEWRAYVKNSVVLPYASLQDASKKLNMQSGNQSPILELFWLAAQNTGVDSPKVQEAFQPVHQTVPPQNLDRYVAPNNQNYLNSLVTLQTSIDQAANAPGAPDPSVAQTTLANATAARNTVKQMAQNFRIDQEVGMQTMVENLLEAPITKAEGFLRGLGPKELNGKGGGLCAQFNLYPFNPNSSADATPQDVIRLLKPREGALWTFYEANLKTLLVQQGSIYVRNPSGGMNVTPGFLNFFNTAAKVSEAFFRSGPDPKLTFSVTPLKAEGFQSLSMTIDGVVLNAPPQGGPAKQFSLPGAGAHESILLAKANGQEFQQRYQGLWSAFRMFDDANTWEPAGNGNNLEWRLQTQTQFGKTSAGAKQGTPARFFLDMNGLPPFFRKGSGAMRCVSQVAQ